MTLPADFLALRDPTLPLVAAGILGSVGIGEHLGPEAYEARAALGLDTYPAAVLVLVDGLGAMNLEARTGHARTLRSFKASEPLTSVIPSTTAAAITALGTARLPGQTGMLGYSLRSPASGEAFSLITWPEEAVRPEQWQGEPTLFERLGPAAEECRLVQPRAYIGSGLSRAALRGVQAIGAELPHERIEAAAWAVKKGARFVYLYWGELDRIGHREGWESQAWIEGLEELDLSMRRLATMLPAGTLLALTADHGMIDAGRRYDLADNAQLASSVALLAGEDRAAQAYTDDPGGVAERWKEELGDDALVLMREEAVELGLFGPPGPRVRHAGDVIAFMRSNAVLVDSRARPADKPFMVGVHGSLTPMEMLVPFLKEVI